MSAKKPDHSGCIRSARGATILEFAIVSPLIFLFILGLIEISRYWNLRTAAVSVAQHGLGLAVVLPGLDRDANTSPEVLATEFEPALAQVRNAIKERSKELLLAPMNAIGDSKLSYDPVVLIPTQNEMKDTPIQVAVTVPYQSLFSSFIGFPSVDIVVAVAGFREPKRVAALPVPTDCLGTPYDITTPPGGGTYREGCPCEAGPLSFVHFGQCVCSGRFFNEEGEDGISYGNGTTLQEDGQCGCGEDRELMLPFAGTSAASQQVADIMNAMSALCCPIGTPKVCPPGQMRNLVDGQCDCQCLSGATYGETNECVCSDPKKKYTPEGCVCKTPEESNNEVEECTGGAQRDPATCDCGCTGGAMKVKTSGCLDSTPSYECQCKGAATLVDNTCVCGLTCQSPLVLDSANCKCSCPPGQISNPDGSCGCPVNKIIQGSACVCDPSIASTCLPDQVVDPNTCACTCPNNGIVSNGHCCPVGASYDTSSGSCSCGDPRKEVVGNKCVCKNEPPPPMTPLGAYKNGNCDWICPPNTINHGYICCPSDSDPFAEPTMSGCNCDDPDKTWDVFKGKCVCSNATPCPAGQHRNANTCECTCPPDATPTSDGLSCQCSDPNKGWTNGSCQCNPCPAGFTRKPGSCECSCEGNDYYVIKGMCAGKWCGEDCDFSVSPSGEVNCDCRHR